MSTHQGGVVSVPDLIITCAYFSIPFCLVFSLLRYPHLTRKLAMTKVVLMLILFALFILLCGAGHLMRCTGAATDDSTLFHVLNILTAIVSLTTAVCLVPIAPNLLAEIDEHLSNYKRSQDLVDSMYPKSIKDRLMDSLKTAGSARFNLSSGNGPTTGAGANSGAQKEQFRRVDNNDSRGSLSLGSLSSGEICGALEMDAHDDSSSTGNMKRCSSKSSMSKMARLSRRLSNSFASDNVGRIQHFLKGSPQSHVANTRPDYNVEREVSDPIAETFPSVSILFADIVGFTAWSSKHEPDDVFELLESLYWEFDELAKTMGIFKIGTVGDCYIAACGVPNASADHAVHLCQFADLALEKLSMVIRRLSPSLGSDTLDLDMRFGIHSGPITAGVLRGHKSRFELFGDTINTSSRMESTGLPHRIQISQQTADLLSTHGKTDWFAEREEPIYAKGKGELQTYWLRRGVGGASDHLSPEKGNIKPSVIISCSSTICNNENPAAADLPLQIEQDEEKQIIIEPRPTEAGIVSVLIGDIFADNGIA